MIADYFRSVLMVEITSFFTDIVSADGIRDSDLSLKVFRKITPMRIISVMKEIRFRFQ